jgi:hypothetical protein
MIWLWVSGLLMAITAVIHSVAGERMLIGPILAKGQNAIPTVRGRKVLRSAWHLTSAFMLTNALVVAWPDTAPGLKIAIGGFWLVVGLFSLISSRGQHVGWPTLTGSGLTALIGSLI